MPFKDKQKRKEYRKGYMQTRRKENPILENALRKKCYENLKEKNLDYWKENYIKHRDKIMKRTKSNQMNDNIMYKVRYLTSSNWKKESKCGICGETKRLNFHHWRYRLPVQKKDFSTLCTYCHGVQHGGKRQ